jgi:hypothetical protein
LKVLRVDEKKQPFDTFVGSQRVGSLVLSEFSSTYPVVTFRMAQFRYCIKKRSIGQAFSFGLLLGWSSIVFMSLQWYRVITTVSVHLDSIELFLFLPLGSSLLFSSLLFCTVLGSSLLFSSLLYCIGGLFDGDR